ncbi:unnamed protein product [Paramecium sonneborni]|uniref:Uncharacterized protein n=1 Tax=Paramecium sonneborni TaxID=65129 RepID=A0A8S1MYA6_9CILI|nr:unnamed protein product [Paramecium sonneborni]
MNFTIFAIPKIMLKELDIVIPINKVLGTLIDKIRLFDTSINNNDQILLFIVSNISLGMVI